MAPELVQVAQRLFGVADVQVAAVNTMIMKPKRRKLGRKSIVTRPAWKRAVVTLAAGERIQDFFEGV